MPSPTSGIEALARTLATAAAHSFQRRALLLAGERPWCRDTAGRALRATDGGQVLWIGDTAPPGVQRLPGSRVHRVLGRELDTVVLDAHAGFDPDALGAAAGTIRGGGLLLLLTPPLDDWPGHPDPEHARIAVAPFAAEAVAGRYLRRLSRLFAVSQELTVVSQGDAIPVAAARESLPAAPPQAPGDCRTPDQQQAVDALIRVARGHRHRPLVLTSDRGRGKSAALGIAAARLLQGGSRLVIITAPRLDACIPALEQAARLLPAAQTGRGHVRLETSALEFSPPDALGLSPRRCDLLLVDEAAAIPTPLLDRLLLHYPRIAFATTVHGYEGNGRGFAVRFRRTLERLRPGWRELELGRPIRWAPGDPVERLVFRTLLLDAAPAPDAALAGIRPGECTILRLDRDRLAADEATLAQLFGLLVLAHYRTTPLDLRHLLDGPNLSVYVLTWQGQVAATALVAEEGGLAADLAPLIHAGCRRLRGHLLPQTLSQHLGLEQAPTLRCHRVMRIAVHPAAQGRGLGSLLLRAVADAAREAGMDYVGTSFGATPELLRFWARAGFDPVRMGISRGKSSGTRSVVLMAPLSAYGQALATAARERFHANLPHMLGDALRDLEPELALPLLRSRDGVGPPQLAPGDWHDLVTFAFGLRVYELCPAPVWTLARTALADPRATIGGREQALLVLRALQRRSWQETAAALGLRGRDAAVTALRLALRPLILRYAGPETLREAQRLTHLLESRDSF